MRCINVRRRGPGETLASALIASFIFHEQSNANECNTDPPERYEDGHEVGRCSADFINVRRH